MGSSYLDKMRVKLALLNSLHTLRALCALLGLYEFLISEGFFVMARQHRVSRYQALIKTRLDSFKVCLPYLSQVYISS